MQSNMQYLSTSLPVRGSDLDDHINDVAGAGRELVTTTIEHGTRDDRPDNTFYLIWRRQFDPR